MSSHQHQIEKINVSPADENSKIPLYHQVRIDLMRILQSEAIKPGDLLPSENALAEAYGVSRQTIRQAIGLLAAQNYLERTPGRGTTVISNKDRQLFYLDQSFAQQLIEIGQSPHSEVLRKKIITIDNTTPLSLNPKQGSKALELIRLRFGNNNPIGVQYTTIVMDLCSDLDEQNFEQESLYNLLLNHYRLPIARIDQAVSAVLPDEWHKNLLKMSETAPLLLVNTTAYLENNDPIESSTSYYRADKFEFSISKTY